MKIAVYSYIPEKEDFSNIEEKFHVTLKLCKEHPDKDNLDFAKGCDAVSVVTTKINEEIITGLKANGVKFISTRTIGYDHIDLAAAKKLGIGVGNVDYSPNSVAEYALMLILMSLRKVNIIMDSYKTQDFTTNSVMGKQLNKQTVGIIGTGKIGETLIHLLSGSGCRIVAYDPYEKDKLKDKVTYMSLKELYQVSDVISLHIPATKENYHLINEESLYFMKENVILVNTARGDLIDTKALIDAIEMRKVGAVALDVLEEERKAYFSNKKAIPIVHRDMAILRSFPNVILTPHFAFFTDQAVKDMAEHSIESCILELEGKENPWKVL